MQRHLTHLKVQPIETKCLDEAEDGFAKEPGSISKSETPILGALLDIVRIDAEWSFVLIKKGYDRISKHESNERVGSFGYDSSEGVLRH